MIGIGSAPMHWTEIAERCVGAVSSVLSISEESLGELLAVYAGFFLYMGATDLLPHAHEHPSVKRVALTLAGFAAIFLVSLIGQ